MIIKELYTLLKRRGLVANYAAFSLDYLNKGPRYYDYLICTRKAPAIDAMMSLFVRVSAIADDLATNPSMAMHAAEMTTLTNAIWVELERRSCSVLPLNRARPGSMRVIQGRFERSRSYPARIVQA